jgi:hypothetical protein
MAIHAEQVMIPPFPALIFWQRLIFCVNQAAATDNWSGSEFVAPVEFRRPSDVQELLE